MKLSLRLIVCALSLALPASAETVQLVTRDGNVVLEGKILNRDGELFRIETEYGPLTVDSGGLICSGAGCPDPAELTARARFGGRPDMMHRLLPALLEVFADSSDLNALRTYIDDETVSWELRDATSDRLMAIFDTTVLDFGSLSGAVTSGEVDMLLGRLEASAPIRQDVIALDALVPAVAPENPRAMVTHGEFFLCMIVYFYIGFSEQAGHSSVNRL